MKSLAASLVAWGVFVLFSPIILANEQPPPEMAPWYGYHGAWHSHGHGFWWIFPLMMIFMFIFFFFFLSRNREHGWMRRWRSMFDYPESREKYPDDQIASSESALDILDKRYARGEIDKEEYEDKKATIIGSEK